MRSNRIPLRQLMLAGAFAAMLSGCAPALSGVGLEISYVHVAPPPRRVERIPPPPGRGFFWIEGYWGWRASRYIWVPGYWDRPPRPKARWVKGRWKKDRRGWYWIPGHWR